MRHHLARRENHIFAPPELRQHVAATIANLRLESRKRKYRVALDLAGTARRSVRFLLSAILSIFLMRHDPRAKRPRRCSDWFSSHHIDQFVVVGVMDSTPPGMCRR